MFQLKSGDRDNSNAIQLLELHPDLRSMAEEFSLIELQEYLDRTDQSNKTQRAVDLIEVTITISDELYGSKVNQDTADNMWFQWCVNRYNRDEYHIASFQAAEDLMRRTGNDYRKLLNHISDEVYMATFEIPNQLFQLIEGTQMYIKLPTNVVNLDGKDLYVIDFDNKAQVEVVSGIKERESFVDKIPVEIIIPNMRTGAKPNGSLLGFAKRDPGNFGRSIDFTDSNIREKLLDNAWAASRSLDAYNVEVAQQWEPDKMVLGFVTDEDAQEALNTGQFQEVNLYRNREDSAICYVSNQPFIVQWKGDRLIPRFRK